MQPWCAQRGLDFAWVPEARKLADLRLVAMDMDSTLVTIESIDEMGDLLGIRERIASITAQAMRGEIDYAESLRRRVALLAGLEEAALERICRAAHAPLARRRGAGRALAASAESAPCSSPAASISSPPGCSSGSASTRCCPTCWRSRAARLTGRVLGAIVDGAAKAAKLRAEMHRLGLQREQALAIGDGANDIPMMSEAGISVAYRAKPAVREHATHALDHAPLDGVLNLFL